MADEAEAGPAGSRERSSFDVFFEDEFPGLTRALFLVVGDSEEAHDVAQSAMVRVLERWDRVASLDSPKAYLYRVAFNLNKRRVRRLIRSRALENARALDARDPADVVGARTDVRRALQAMSPRDREILVLADWLGMNGEEMARILGLSHGNVRVRLHRAREAFRNAVGEHYG